MGDDRLRFFGFKEVNAAIGSVPIFEWDAECVDFPKIIVGDWYSGHLAASGNFDYVCHDGWLKSTLLGDPNVIGHVVGGDLLNKKINALHRG